MRPRMEKGRLADSYKDVSSNSITCPKVFCQAAARPRVIGSSGSFVFLLSQWGCHTNLVQQQQSCCTRRQWASFWNHCHGFGHRSFCTTEPRTNSFESSCRPTRGRRYHGSSARTLSPVAATTGRAAKRTGHTKKTAQAALEGFHQRGFQFVVATCAGVTISFHAKPFPPFEQQEIQRFH